REVKPARANGTAVTRGRVGRRLILQSSPFIFDARGFLHLYTSLVSPQTKSKVALPAIYMIDAFAMCFFT
ncbi:hypothetical protein, partial [Mucilaginibacter galii]|uniref:hypothetical protein n=1 Tax=Mucilaginibacter galii TaxID=2005073 RepID=UPI0039F05B38